MASTYYLMCLWHDTTNHGRVNFYQPYVSGTKRTCELLGIQLLLNNGASAWTEDAFVENGSVTFMTPTGECDLLLAKLFVTNDDSTHHDANYVHVDVDVDVDEESEDENAPRFNFAAI